mgnify:CR=1 FL=1
MPYIRNAVEVIQGFVEKLNGMSEGQKKVVATIALIVAAIGPLLITIGKVATGVSAITKLFSKMKTLTTITSILGKVKGAFSALFGSDSRKPGYCCNSRDCSNSDIAVHKMRMVPGCSKCSCTKNCIVFYRHNTAGVEHTDGFSFRSSGMVVWNLATGIRLFMQIWNGIVNFFTVTIPQAWNGVVTFFAGVSGVVVRYLAAGYQISLQISGRQ